MQDENKDKKGHVYVVLFDTMPGLCKIGRAKDADARIHGEAKRSAFLPGNFRYRYVEVEDMYAGEARMHEVFDDYRFDGECFKGCQDMAWKAIVLMAKDGEYYEYPPEEKSGETPPEKAEKPRYWTLPRLCEKAEIPVDATFTWKDKSNTVVKYMGGNEVLYEGNITSLSRIVQEKLGWNFRPAAFHHWKYNGELLEDIKQKLVDDGVKP